MTSRQWRGEPISESGVTARRFNTEREAVSCLASYGRQSNMTVLCRSSCWATGRAVTYQLIDG